MVRIPEQRALLGADLEGKAAGLGRTSVALVAFRHQGELRAAVIVKASFAFASEAVATRVEAAPIERREAPSSAGGPRRFGSDLVPFVERAEVTVTGTAYASAVGVQLFDGQRAIVSRRIEIAGGPRAGVALSEAEGLGPIDRLRGDEWIVLDGLHPTMARVRTRLPGARGFARIFGLATSGVREGQPLELEAEALRVDADAGRCSLLFRGSVRVADEAALGSLRIVAGVETPGEAIPWSRDDTRPISGRYRPSASAVAASTALLGGAATTLLGGAETVVLSDADLAPSPRAAPATALLSEDAPLRVPALPFQPVRGPSPEARPSASPALRVATGTVNLATAIDDSSNIAPAVEAIPEPRPRKADAKASPWAPPPTPLPPAASAPTASADPPPLDILAELYGHPST